VISSLFRKEYSLLGMMVSKEGKVYSNSIKEGREEELETEGEEGRRGGLPILICARRGGGAGLISHDGKYGGEWGGGKEEEGKAIFYYTFSNEKEGNLSELLIQLSS